MINYFSLKNYFVNSAAMNKKSIINTPKFVIAVNDSSTVESNVLRFFHDFTILKILSNLKALKTERLELDSLPPEAKPNST